MAFVFWGGALILTFGWGIVCTIVGVLGAQTMLGLLIGSITGVIAAWLAGMQRFELPMFIFTVYGFHAVFGVHLAFAVMLAAPMLVISASILMGLYLKAR